MEALIIVGYVGVAYLFYQMARDIGDSTDDQYTATLPPLLVTISLVAVLAFSALAYTYSKTGTLATEIITTFMVPVLIVITVYVYIFLLELYEQVIEQLRS